MRALIGAFFTGSFQPPVKVQFLPPASQEPSLTISPVDIESFQVDQYFPVTLSNPIMPCPTKGVPIIVDLNSSVRTRPSSVMARVTVPVDSSAGPFGSCQLLTLTS